MREDACATQVWVLLMQQRWCCARAVAGASSVHSVNGQLRMSIIAAPMHGPGYPETCQRQQQQ